MIPATLMASQRAGAGTGAAWTKQEERSRIDGAVRVSVVQAATEPPFTPPPEIVALITAQIPTR